jgi:outer membrane immunogenic protein
VGANGGYQWGSVTRSSTNPSGFLGGIQAGYNWEIGQFVAGVETDIQGSGAEDTFAAWKFSNPWFGTLRGRGGYALNNRILFYATLGLAYGGIHAESLGLTESKVHTGWTAGAGVEVKLPMLDSWSVKAEYLFIDLTNRAYGLTGTTNGYESNILRFGVNYRF